MSTKMIKLPLKRHDGGSTRGRNLMVKVAGDQEAEFPALRVEVEARKAELETEVEAEDHHFEEGDDNKEGVEASDDDGDDDGDDDDDDGGGGSGGELIDVDGGGGGGDVGGLSFTAMELKSKKSKKSNKEGKTKDEEGKKEIKKKKEEDAPLADSHHQYYDQKGDVKKKEDEQRHHHNVGNDEKTTTATYRWPLHNCQMMQLSATIEVGTPPQPMNVMLDTGSADLWVLREDCQGTMCDLEGPRYNTALSSSFKDLKVPYTSKYASNNGFTGTMVEDKLQIAGLSVDHQYFAAINQANSLTPCAPVAIQGYLGLWAAGFQKKTSGRTVFENLAHQHDLLPVFSFSLGSITGAGGHVTLGGVDYEDYEGCITWAPLIPAVSGTLSGYLFWSFSLGPRGGVAIGDGPVFPCPPGRGCTAMPDSGTSFLNGKITDSCRLLVAMDALCVGTPDEHGKIPAWPCQEGCRKILQPGYGKKEHVSHTEESVKPITSSSLPSSSLERVNDRGNGQVKRNTTSAAYDGGMNDDVTRDYVGDDDDGGDEDHGHDFWARVAWAQIPCDAALPPITLTLDINAFGLGGADFGGVGSSSSGDGGGGGGAGGDGIGLAGIRSFTLRQEDYIFPPHYFGPEKELEGYCVLGIGWMPEDSAVDWTLGDTFMRKYLTVHDTENMRVGFALSSKGKRTTGRCHTDEQLFEQMMVQKTTQAPPGQQMSSSMQDTAPGKESDKKKEKETSSVKKEKEDDAQSSPPPPPPPESLVPAAGAVEGGKIKKSSSDHSHGGSDHYKTKVAGGSQPHHLLTGSTSTSTSISSGRLTSSDAVFVLLVVIAVAILLTGSTLLIIHWVRRLRRLRDQYTEVPSGIA